MKIAKLDKSGLYQELDSVNKLRCEVNMTRAMQFNSVAKINSLFWITSLGGNEIGVTNRILEDLEPSCASRGLTFEKLAPTTASELLIALDEIAARATSGMLPIIHFDTHGSVDGGIHIVQSGENISWPDIADKLRIINEITGNNLCVVSCACFSFHVVSEIDINRSAPFYILIAPEQEIPAGDIESNIVKFYQDMLDEEDIITAHKRRFDGTLRVFHCEKMLAIVLAKYVNNAGLGKQRARRKEDLVSMAINLGLPRNRKNLRALRKQANKLISVREDLIKRFLPTFLCGKRPGFSIAQIKDLVIEARANGLEPQGPYARQIGINPASLSEFPK